MLLLVMTSCLIPVIKPVEFRKDVVEQNPVSWAFYYYSVAETGYFNINKMAPIGFKIVDIENPLPPFTPESYYVHVCKEYERLKSLRYKEKEVCNGE